MRRCHIGRVLTVAAIMLLQQVLIGRSLAQAAPPVETPQPEVTLTKLSPPTFPPLALMARIQGDVQIQVDIRKDGSVASVSLVSGHPMLTQAALESAQKSQYECRGCSESATSYLLTYSFADRVDGDCCDAQNREPEVTQKAAHITIASPPMCLCDPPSSRKVRSAKCLYLWRCAFSDH
jgi:TonB family protein